MSKRVYEIVRELSWETSQVIKRLREAGAEVNSNLAVVDKETYEQAFGDSKSIRVVASVDPSDTKDGREKAALVSALELTERREAPFPEEEKRMETKSNSYRIRDLDTFAEVTNASGHEIAGLYFFMRLDCLIDLAHQVSIDFFKRPHQYTNLGHYNGAPKEDEERSREEGTEIAQLLARLNARYGTDEQFLSKAQRDEIYISLFGQSSRLPLTNAEGDFADKSGDLMNAATAFAERVYDTGEDMLRESVRVFHRPFKEWLNGLQGSSVKWSRNYSLPTLTEQTAYPILRNQGVAAIFGVATPPKSSWPLVEDSNGDKLAEEISKQLTWEDMSADMPATLISRGLISDLQRAALRGAEAIAAVLDYEEVKDKDADEKALDTLITKAYTWSVAEKSLPT